MARDTIGFDESCRVTVYRLQSDDGNYFKRVFRYSKNQRYCNEGRVRIPVAQGFVGKAWGNHGECEFSSTGLVGTFEFKRDLAAELDAAECTLPPDGLSMPSRWFFAKAVEDSNTTKRVAIIVFESVEADKLDSEKIRALMASETLQVSRYVRHLGVLDREFNPVSGGGEANG